MRNENWVGWAEAGAENKPAVLSSEAATKIFREVFMVLPFQ
jgi:hypothetical protein